ncbi:MAG: Shedu immune nuclease family protein [Vampirovibrionales bacterium]
MSIEFEIDKYDNDIYLLKYELINSDDNWIEKKLFAENKENEAGIKFGQLTYHFLKDQVSHYSIDKQCIYFKFAIKNKDYWILNSSILKVKSPIHIHESILLNDKLFRSKGISIFQKIAKLLKENEPIILGGENPTAIPLEDYKIVQKNYPSATELNHYANSRITTILKTYFESMRDSHTLLNNYQNKMPVLPKNPKKDKWIYDSELQKYEYLHTRLEQWLNGNYYEKEWQNEILKFIRLIFPKYIYVKRELKIPDFTKTHMKKRKIDIALIDINGNIDIIEIKKPEDNQLLSKGKDRENYRVAMPLNTAIMQAEKYIYHLNRIGESGRDSISRQLGKNFPTQLKINVIHPKSIIIIGRDNQFNEDQKFDFEIIKRKYSHVAEIITYDDLLRRLGLIIQSLK